MIKDRKFQERVYQIVQQIPKGRVMTYSQIAALCGRPRAARNVGGIAHFGPVELPWQRVVNKTGGLARGYTSGGRLAHRRELENEGVIVDDSFRVDVEKLTWWPN